MIRLPLARPGGRPLLLLALAAISAAGLALLPGEGGPLAARAALGALAVGGAALLWRRGARPRAFQPALLVTARAGFGRAAGVAVVEVDGRRLLVGVSEGSVELLCELDPAPGGRP